MASTMAFCCLETSAVTIVCFLLLVVLLCPLVTTLTCPASLAVGNGILPLALFIILSPAGDSVVATLLFLVLFLVLLS